MKGGMSIIVVTIFIFWLALSYLVFKSINKFNDGLKTYRESVQEFEIYEN